MRDPIRVQVFTAVGLLVVVIVVGGFALRSFSGENYTFFDSIYFAMITVSTVGYGEMPNMQSHPAARVITMALIVAGVASIAFFQSTLTTLFVEGTVGKAFRRRRMDNRIAALKRHVIIVGSGRTGRFVVEEMVNAGRPCVVVDLDRDALERLNEDLGGRLLYIVGDGTEDDVLIAAGAERASGLVATLTEDRDNLFVTLTARSINPKLRIVAKAFTPSNEAKLGRAGADATVSPHRMGGLRLAVELLRPHTAEFLDTMMSGSGEGQLRFEDVEVRKGGKYEGHSLREAPIRSHTNVLVVALRKPSGQFVYNPPADQVLEAGSYIVVLGPPDGVLKLREMLGSA